MSSPLPAVHFVLAEAEALVIDYGHQETVSAIRDVLAVLREAGRNTTAGEAAAAAARLLQERHRPRLRRVLNLTGTVLHTNLGRALLPQEAVDAAMMAMTAPVALEFDLDKGKRGERDDLVEDWLCRLTGAEAATVVNNNAAAVLLMLSALAAKRDVVVSRGELVEIGGSFRVPDVMACAGCKLVEVGATNRTHAKDYESVIGPKTAALMRVHASNYAITGFTSAVPDAELAAIAQRHGLPFLVDLGAGSLVEMERFGLPHETTPKDALAAGADLVTFSGDKLLGGPQAGIVVGRRDLVAKLKKNPLKRALRMDKMRLAALEAVLKLYADHDRLALRLPTLRLLTRPASEIEAQAQRLLPKLTAKFADGRVSIEPCRSQIGSGALPVDLLDSFALVLRPPLGAKGEGRFLDSLSKKLRELPTPVIGRVADGALWLDLRCLEKDDDLAGQL
ncbi:MAG: L-seryl-tRNA(Sec) selenium transferase [Rhodospirillales bacterium]|nr:L-seryl-tRNA(Sec) selenium transferase [Rhodospirillales bacterium]